MEVERLLRITFLLNLVDEACGPVDISSDFESPAGVNIIDVRSSAICENIENRIDIARRPVVSMVHTNPQHELQQTASFRGNMDGQLPDQTAGPSVQYLFNPL